MQTLKKFYFGRQKLKPNTFIGGIGSIINTPALLAARLGISVNRIKLFKVTGVDVECAVIGGSYSIPIDCFINTYFTSGSPTYYKDIDGLVSSIGRYAFYNSLNTLEFYFPNCISIGEKQFYHSNYNNLAPIKSLYIPRCTSFGNTVNTDEAMFNNTFRETKAYFNPILSTANSGSPDQDIIKGKTIGLTERYVTNFTPPNAITNLSSGTIYNTTIQLNFTPPTAVNGVDFYEVYVDGKYNNDTRDFLATGLLPSTSYRIKIRAVDMFYNKGNFSNEITVTTLTSNDFISTWKTDNISTGSSSTTQIKLPLVSSGNYNFTVDWGDGTQNTITAWNQVDTVHTYSAIGVYTVRINGVCNGWYFGNSGDRLKLLSIVDWGRLQLSNGNVFHGCSNLSLQNVQGFLDLHYVTSMSSFFAGCSSITTINNVNSWPVGNVQGMNNMFSGATSFNQNIGGWNTSMVTNMSSMFSSSWNFNNGGSPSIGNWNTSNVINMANMFQNCAFNQNISNWNTSKVTSMAGMFYKSSTAGGFNNGLASGVGGDMFWDMSKVTNVSQMFQNASDFNQNLGVLNLSLCTNFTSMFNGATKFNNGGSIDINNWTLNTTNPVTMNSMFLNATVFNQPIGNWNIINVTSTASMFQGATNFNNGLASGVAGNMFWNFRNVNSTSAMFFNSTSFEQNLGAVNMSKNTVLTDMFNGATKFNNGGSIDINNWTLNTTSPVTMNSMFLNATVFNQSIGNWNTIKVTTTASMFSGASAFNNGLTSGVPGNMFWDLSSVGNVQSMFNGATSFNQNLGALNLLNCSNFTSMFQNAIKFNNGGSADINNWALATVGSINFTNMFSGAVLFNQPIGNWNTSRVTNMTSMFGAIGAVAAFNQNIGSWNVSSVTSMFQMFLNARFFNNGGDSSINSWNTLSVTNMSELFRSTGSASPGFNQLIGNWNVSNVANMSGMFQYQSSFNQDIGLWNVSKVSAMNLMFDQALAFNNGGSSSINNWNPVLCTNMSQMFSSAPAFNQPIGSWNVSNVTNFVNFMLTKTPATFSAANLDAIYNGWSSRPVKTPITISFGTAKHSTASSAGKDILIMTPNNWTIGDGGSTDGIANTYIGGIGSTINTPALLATKLGISTNRIENFSVTGSDVECIVIGGSYTAASLGFNNDSTITYFDDREGLITAFGYRFIRSAPNMLWVNFPNVTSLSDECFLGSHKLRELILPKLTAWTGGYCGCRIMNSLKVFKAPLLTTFNFTSSQEIFQSLPSLKTIIIPKQKSLGASSLRESQVFSGSTLISGSRLVIDPFVQTTNSGGLEGDVSFFLSNGGIVSFTYNENLPDPIADLSTVKIYNTSVQLNFTTPTAVNGIDFYEVYVNGKLNKEIKNSGEFITGLTPATNYNITVAAVDVFYNKSAFSNAVNFTTTNKTATDTDAIAYINASSNSFYQDIIDDMFIGLKNQNLYTKIQAFYPFLGTTQAQHKWNAKNPLDTNAAFRLQFFGGATHSNLGYQCNGTNAYANSFFAVNLNANINSFGATIVCGTNNANSGSDVTEMGSTNPASATNMFRLAVRQSNTSKLSYFSSYNQANGAFFTNNVDCRGVFTGLRNSISENKLFINKTLKASGTGGGTASTGGIYIGASNQSSSPFGYSNQRIQFTAIHEGLPDAEVVALHTIIDNFEAAIGRKTW